MIMEQKQNEKILEDLFAIDPSLKSKKAELDSVIKIMQARKDTGYDKAFYEKLRERLIFESSQKSKNYGRRFVPVLAVLSLVLLCFVGIFTFDYFNSPEHPKIAMERVQDNAFGKFSSENEGNDVGVQGTARPDHFAPASIATDGGEYAAGVLNQPTLPGANALGYSAKAMLSANPVYRYAYIGDNFIQSEPKMDVLKKISQPLFSDFNFGNLSNIADLRTFSGGNVTTATFQQDEPFGYIINVDFKNSTVSLSANYEQWQSAEISAEPFVALDENQAIDIANEFLKTHKISVDNYGSVEVLENGYSETAQVVYPMIINGKNVYGADGANIGVFVGVDMRYKKVSSVYGLGAERYQVSSYSVIQDTDEILSIAEKAYPSGYSDGRPSDADMEKQKSNNGIIKIDLGTPQLVYAQISKTDNGVYGEFLVPAFSFPIENPIDSRKRIIVPLVKGLQDASEQPPVRPSYDEDIIK